MVRALNGDGHDLFLVACSVVAALLVDGLLVAWRPSLLLLSGDGPTFYAPHFHDLVEANANPDALLYRPGIAGGVALYGMTGLPIIEWILVKLGFGTIHALNACTIGCQALYGFFAARLALDIARRSLPIGLGPPRAIGPIVCFFAVAAPALATRFAAGHLNLVIGFLAFPAALAVLAASAVRTETITLLGVAALAMADSLACQGAQALTYGLLFGVPLLLAAAIPVPVSGGPCCARGWRALLRTVGPLLLVLTIAVLIALPEAIAMTAQARSSDAVRRLGDNIAYEYGALSVVGFVRSWLWDPTAWPSSEWMIWDDHTYGIGPLFVVTLALLSHDGRRLLAMWLLGLAFAAVLSLRIQPLAGWMLDALPLLRSFRAPSRSLFVFASLVVPLAGAVFAHAFTAPSWRTFEKREVRTWLWALLFVLLACAICALPPLGREAIVWAVSLCFALFCLVPPLRTRPPFCPALLFFPLVTGAALAFSERYPPLELSTRHENAVDRLAQRVRTTHPELNSPLVRAHVVGTRPPYHYNEGHLLGLSTLDAYAFPQRRFLELVAACEAAPVQLTRNLLHFASASSAFPCVRVLYNIRAIVHVDPTSGSVEVRDAGPTLGEAWFAQHLFRAESMDALAGLVRDRVAAGEMDSLRRTAPWVSTDQTAASVANDFGTSDCSNATVHRIQSFDHGQRFELHVSCPGTCPLVLSTNFADGFRAEVKLTDNRNVMARTLPLYGGLLGIAVPAGAAAVSVRFEPPVRTSFRIAVASLAGLIVLGALVVRAGGGRALWHWFSRARLRRAGGNRAADDRSEVAGRSPWI